VWFTVECMQARQEATLVATEAACYKQNCS
jgi:hypothetical protein